jgi:hypothetical protein
LRAITKPAGACEVFDYFFAIANDTQGVGNVSALICALEKNSIVFIVFGEQDKFTTLTGQRVSHVRRKESQHCTACEEGSQLG